MRSSFLSFAPDVSKEQCQAEHWIDIENVSESVKMTPEEIENLNARILRTYGTEMHDLKKKRELFMINGVEISYHLGYRG